MVTNQLNYPPVELAAALEKTEAEYWSKLYQSSNNLTAIQKEVAGAKACTIPAIDILAMNRVIAWGWSSKAPAQELEELIDFYTDANCKRFFVQLSPLAPARDQLIPLLKSKGFRLYNYWSKLWRPINTYTPAINSFFHVQLISKDQAALYGQAIFQSFGWSEPQLIAWLAGGVGQDGYRHYLVYDDQKVVAAGALHLQGEYASLAFAGTLAEYRSMGAQSLLIQQRIADAKKLGAKYLIVETGHDRPEYPVMSFRNMLKFGFHLAYLRENWIWER